MSASIWAPGNNLVTVDAESTNLSQVFTATDSQIVFILTEFSYAVGTGSLAVYRGGQRLILGTDWTETTSTSISLTGFTIAAGEVIEVVAVLGSASSASIAAQAAAAEAAASAASVSASILPSQTGQAGQFLTTNGTTTDWVELDALPDQTGNAGEFLTTNGTVASWAAIIAVGDVTLNGVQTLTNKTITTPVINTNINFSGASGAIQVGGVDKVVVGATGIEAGSYKAGSVASADLATAAKPLGVGQTWQNFTGSRTVGASNYTNGTGRPITVHITQTSSGQVLFWVDGLQIQELTMTASVAGSFSVVVPAGSTYGTTAGVGTRWMELR